MDKKLQYWRLEKYISFHVATCLILDEEPSYVDERLCNPSVAEFPFYQKIYDELINDFRTYLENPQDDKWLNDVEIFAHSLGRTRFGFDYFEGDSFEIDHTLLVKQTAIKEWLKSKPIKSEYFDSLCMEDKVVVKAGDILKMKEPGKKDDLFKAMLFFIKEFEQENNKTPTYSELWGIFKDSDLSKWDLTFGDNKIKKGTGKHTDYDAFKERFKNYYPEPSNK